MCVKCSGWILVETLHISLVTSLRQNRVPTLETTHSVLCKDLVSTVQTYGALEQVLSKADATTRPFLYDDDGDDDDDYY